MIVADRVVPQLRISATVRNDRVKSCYPHLSRRIQTCYCGGKNLNENTASLPMVDGAFCRSVPNMLNTFVVCDAGSGFLTASSFVRLDSVNTFSVATEQNVSAEEGLPQPARQSMTSNNESTLEMWCG